MSEPTRAGEGISGTQIAVAAVALLAAVVLVGWLLGADADEAGDSEGEFDVQSASPDGDSRAAGRSAAAMGNGSTSGVSQDGDEAAEIGEDEEPAIGPRRWMADADGMGVDVEALERRLDEGQMRQDFELALREDRRTSIDLAEQVVDDCYEEMKHRTVDDRNGRVALGWIIETEAGRGRIDEVEILHQLGGRDQLLEQCIHDGLQAQEFDAVGDGGHLQVRWAFGDPID